MFKNNLLIISLFMVFISSLILQGLFEWIKSNGYHDFQFQKFTTSLAGTTLQNWQSVVLQVLSFAVLASFFIKDGLLRKRK